MSRSTTPNSTSVPRTTRPRKPRTTAAPIATPDATALASVQSFQSTLTHDVIAARAYELFLSDGATHGRDVEHWLRAEHELRAQKVVSEN
jgi:Protein of unknown function (DUF2934)